MNLKNKKVLVAGTGLIGTPLIRQLVEMGTFVRATSLDHRPNISPNVEFIRADLTEYDNCLKVCENIDYVFNLLCVKGPPGSAEKYPVDSYENMVLFNLLLLKAAWASRVNGYLYTSSVGVYQQAEVLKEEDVWKTQPSENDWFPGHAKRAGEIHLEAYRKQYGWDTAIVRPTNIYGPYDNFKPPRAMFIPSIIRQFAEKINPIVINGDGSQIRDFLHSEDAARGIIITAENSAGPVNLCSGQETTVKEVVDLMVKIASYKGGVIYDTSKPSGDKKRVMDISKLKALDFEPKIDLEDGLATTYEWYQAHKNVV